MTVVVEQPNPYLSTTILCLTLTHLGSLHLCTFQTLSITPALDGKVSNDSIIPSEF